MKLITSLTLALLLCAAPSLLAQSSTRSAAPVGSISAESFLRASQPSAVTITQAATQRLLTLDAAVARPLLASGSDLVLTDFPIAQKEDGVVELRLQRPIIDANTQVWIGSDHGDVPGKIPNVMSYRGKIRGEAGSRVFISLVDGEMFGVIERAAGSSSILAPAPASQMKGAHLLVPESLFAMPGMEPQRLCGADQTPNYFRSGKLPFKAAVLSSELLEVRIAVEADNAFLERTGGTVVKATAYIAAMFGMVSSMYEDELNVTFYLPWIKVWTTADPYQVAGNGYALFDKATTYWRANYQGVDRQLAHVLTGSEWGGGGIGFRGEGIDGRAPVICSKDYGYSVSSPRGVLNFPTYAFTYDAYIVAHELGHNFGARHTHDCWWSPAIDTCYTKDDAKFKLDDACHSQPITPRPSSGSIMSYCAGVNFDASGGVFDSSKVELTFTPRVAAVMRQEVELARCVTAPPDPTILLTSPRGKTKQYNAGSPVDIAWSSSRISNVTIEYSIDNGTTWLVIASGLPVSPEKFSWSIPNVCSDQVLVRIHDASNPLVADSSLLSFSIVAALPTITRSNDTLRSSEAAGYQWNLEALPIAGATGRTYLPLVDGHYSVTITDENSCVARSAAYLYSRTSRVESLDGLIGGMEDLKVVIEPAAGQISIECRLSQPESIGITLFDSQGRSVALLPSQEHPGGSATMSWPIPALPSGSYIVEIRAGDNVVTRKVVVRK